MIQQPMLRRRLRRPGLFILATLFALLSAASAPAFDRLEVEFLELPIVDGQSAATEGRPFDLRVRAVHPDGSTDSGAGFLRIGLRSPDVAASVPGSQTLQQGISTFRGIILEEAGSGLRLEAFDIDDSSLPAGVSTLDSHAPATRFVLDPGGGPWMAGESFRVGIRAENALGDPVRNFRDDLELELSRGDFLSGTMRVLDGDAFLDGLGEIFVAVRLAEDSGAAQEILAVSTMVESGASVAASGVAPLAGVRPAAAAQLLWRLPGQTLSAGAPPFLVGMPTERSAGTSLDGGELILADNFGNPVDSGPWPSVAFSMDGSRPGEALPADRTLGAGRTPLGDLRLEMAGERLLHAMASGSFVGEANAQLRINPASFAALVFDDSSYEPGVTRRSVDRFPLRIEAQDAFGNVVPLTKQLNFSVRIGAESDVDWMKMDDRWLRDGVLNTNAQVIRRAFSLQMETNDGEGMTATSGEFRVDPGPYTQIILEWPGMQWDPGRNVPGYRGHFGAATAVRAGERVVATLRPVDAYYNLVAGSFEAQLQTSQSSAVLEDSTQVPFVVEGPTPIALRVYRAGGFAPQVFEAQSGAIQAWNLPVTPGDFSQLVLIAPGESLISGIGDDAGKTGTPDAVTAGESVELLILPSDQWFNGLDSNTEGWPLPASWNSTDSQASLPDPEFAIPSSGFGVGVTLRTVQENGVEVIATVDGKTGTTLIPIRPATLHQFDFTDFGESGPATAGNPFGPLEILARDAFGNLVNDFAGGVAVGLHPGGPAVGPGEIQFANGRWRGDLELRLAGAAMQLTAAHTSGVRDTSEAIEILPGAFARLSLLAPGESPMPGIAPGKSGDAWASVAGENHGVLVQATDRWWNPVEVAASINMHSDVAFQAAQAEGTLLGNDGRGTREARWDLAGEHWLIARDQAGALADSSRIPVLPAAPATMVLLAPGETLLGGGVDSRGKSGEAFPQSVGAPFTVRIQVTDRFHNAASAATGSADLVLISGSGRILQPLPVALDQGFADLLLQADAAGAFLVEARHQSWLPSRSEIGVRESHYEFLLPDGNRAISGPPATFSMGIRLVDSATGEVLPVTRTLSLQARATDRSAANGTLSHSSIELVEGEGHLAQLSYSHPEQILLRVTEAGGREAFSEPLDIRPATSGWRITLPSTAQAGEAFALMIERIDPASGARVLDEDRDFVLRVRSGGQARPQVELSPSGVLADSTGRTVEGAFEFNDQRYDRAEEIVFELIDAEGDRQLSSVLEFLPGPAANLVLSAPENPGLLNAGASTRVETRITDAPGNPVAGHEVRWEMLEGQAHFESSRSGSDAGGLAQSVLMVDAANGNALRLQAWCGNLGSNVLELTTATAPQTQLLAGSGSAQAHGGVVLGATTPLSLASVALENDTREIFYDVDTPENIRPTRLYQGPFTLESLGIIQPGLHTLRFYARDSVGVEESLQTVQLHLSPAAAIAGEVSNRPNPFRAGEEETVVVFTAPEDGTVEVALFDLFGNPVQRTSLSVNAGEEVRWAWDGRNGQSRVVGNGGYLLSLRGAGLSVRRKIAVVK